MALRISARRLASSLNTRTPSIYRQIRAASTATSNLPQETQDAIFRETRLANHDPSSSSSPSAHITSSQAPFMVATYTRPPPIFSHGVGCYLYDIENRKYLDFTAGIAVNALGHADPQFLKVINDQAGMVIHTSNLYHNPWTGELSKLIIEKTREAGGMVDASRVFVCNSGSEANEAAIKFARKVGKVVGGDSKYEFVSFHNSFHGRTMGSLSATPNPKYQKPFAPMVPGFRYGTYNDIEGINELVTEATCGVIIEPIQGEGGVYEASTEFLVALRKRCTEVGAVLIYDEIQCGLGRTGKLWAHANLPKEAHPDILTTAKALANGIPVGATIVTESVAEKIVVGDHGTTFGGNPLASRVAHHVFSRLAAPEMLEGVNTKSAIFKTLLEGLKQKFPELVTEVRGRGLILGLQLTQDPTLIVQMCRERGLLIITAGTNTLRVVPPLVISESEIAEGMGIIENAMSEFVAMHKTEVAKNSVPSAETDKQAVHENAN